MTAFYSSTLKGLSSTDEKLILGSLIGNASQTGFAEHHHAQTEAWKEQIRLLQETCKHLFECFPFAENWHILFEYSIPRRRKRIDAVILASDLIFILEFKIGKGRFQRQDVLQLEDYCLDLRDFHEGSNGRVIVPVLIATSAPDNKSMQQLIVIEHVATVLRLSSPSIAEGLVTAYRTLHQPNADPIEPRSWDDSAYHPVPTIIEAAERLYGGHTVSDISHSHAGVHNLTKTTARLVEILDDAQRRNCKVICFVTGVPGAGKTLTGLNAVHEPSIKRGIFLSGNGPLVKIVSEALAIDDSKRNRKRITTARRQVSTFIQNVHTFLDEYWVKKPEGTPFDQVVVFDEAQRAWTKKKSLRKFHRDSSEPEMMLQIMQRHKEWGAIIALVGGGQEIHDGEAGIAEWGRALNQTQGDWNIYVSPEALTGGPSVVGDALFNESPNERLSISEEPLLHLSLSIRSHKAQVLAEWVNSVLQDDPTHAYDILTGVKGYPIAMTRSLEKARQWLRERTRGTRRCGLLTSSGGIRHRAYGLEVSPDFHRAYPYDKWFLSPETDVRSSYQLEVAAREFECQGLELDMTCVCWAGDFTRCSKQRAWYYRAFTGDKWRSVRGQTARQFLLNKYRVLLTRARQGMVIWIPNGTLNDSTLEPELFDATSDYLTKCGVTSID